MKKEDALLEAALVKAARTRDILNDPRWDDLASGSISREQAAELHALAQQSEATRHYYEAFQPLGAGVRAKMADQILEKLDTAAPEAGGPVPVDSHKPKSRTTSTPAAAPASSQWRRFLPALAAASLAAAALVFVVVRPHHASPELAPYELSLAGGEAGDDLDPGGIRGGPPHGNGLIRLSPGSRLTLTLTPAASVGGPVAARAVLIRDGQVRPWNPPMTITPDGIVHVTGTREELFAGVASGQWQVIWVVGRPGDIPSAEALVAESERVAKEGSNKAFQTLRFGVLLRGNSDP